MKRTGSMGLRRTRPLGDRGLTSLQQAHRDAIAAAAKDLNQLHERWLNPPDLVRKEPDILPALPPRLIPVSDEAARALKTRTLTNLYNERPTWLEHAHEALDRAVFDAYGWPHQIGNEEILQNLLALNRKRAEADSV